MFNVIRGCVSSAVKCNKFQSAAGITTLKVGDNAELSRRISASDVQGFADLTGDRNRIHLEGDKRIVHGALLNGLVSALIGTRLPGHGTILLDQHVKFPKPCYVNEEVRVRAEVTCVRKIVTVSFTVIVPAEKKTVLEGHARIIKPS